MFGEHFGASVPGDVVTLADAGSALSILDEVEGAHRGLFTRRLVDTAAGSCWAYHWPGMTTSFERIADWSEGRHAASVHGR
jgi:gamma-glutamylcyclotransferase (GGCT)/AIG2-like uncharacterized protein YtfP